MSFDLGLGPFQVDPGMVVHHFGGGKARLFLFILFPRNGLGVEQFFFAT